jgi:hypothetical protein
MRCFFNLLNAHEAMLDVEGVEVASVENLRAEVAEAVREIRRGDPSATRDWSGWRLEVTDPSGTVLLTINLGSFRPETLAGLPFAPLLLFWSGEFTKNLADVVPHALTVL